MKQHFRLIVILTALIAIIFLVGNVLLLNLILTPKRIIETVSIDYGIGDPQFRRTMGAILQQPITDGNQIDVLRDGREIYPAIVAAIDGAAHSITLETYKFWGERSAGKIASALAAAAKRGVTVHALPDFIGSLDADSKKFREMEEAGVEVIRWRPPTLSQLPRFNHRTHRKLLIVDGKEGFIGGANIADDQLPEEENAYRDYHFRVRGPVVANMQATFLETWSGASGKFLGGEKYFPELTVQGDLPAQVVNSSPREGRHRMRKMFLYGIAAAEEQITAGTAFFYPDQDFLDALAAAANRGVRVRLIVPGSSGGFNFFRHASINRWRPLLEAGIEIYEYEPGIYHAKLMSIDDQWVSIGSANLDNRSFRINDDANLNVYHEGFARAIRELIEDDLQYTKRCDMTCWKQRPLHHRLYGRIFMLIGSHL